MVSESADGRLRGVGQPSFWSAPNSIVAILSSKNLTALQFFAANLRGEVAIFAQRLHLFGPRFFAMRRCEAALVARHLHISARA